MSVVPHYYTINYIPCEIIGKYYSFIGLEECD